MRRTTTQRGYGSKHQAERKLRLQRYRPGDRCAHGGEQMWWWPLEVARKQLHLPHTADRRGYLPGLSCAVHNLADGAYRKQRIYGQGAYAQPRITPQPRMPLPWQPSRNW